MRVYHHEAPKESFNWVIGSDLVEAIESKTGKLKNHNGGISRLSKRSFFQQFSSLKQKLPDIGRNKGDDKLTYADEKELALDFQVCSHTIRLLNNFMFFVIFYL